jgi:hypothetical protein
MRVVVIGGHTRNIGKTSVMAALIREFASLGWTAVKITQYGHGVCSHDGHVCGCAPEEHPFALTEERDPQGRSDTSRYFAAGARRSLWLRARQGQLGPVVPLLRRKLGGAPWVVIESNSIMEFIEPLLYLVVVDTSRADFKTSAGRWLGRAHALIAVENPDAGAAPKPVHVRTSTKSAPVPSEPHASWPEIDENLRSKPSFPVRSPQFWSPELTSFVRERLQAVSLSQIAAASHFGTAGESEEQTWQH